MRQKYYLTLISCFVFLCASAPWVWASVTLKISASNPSAFSEKVVPLKTYLPQGILPDNVIDADGLNYEYDEERRQTFVYKDLTIQAGESVSFDVEIDDIWLFDEAELNGYRTKAESMVAEMEPTNFGKEALRLQTDILSYITEITQKQDAALITRVGPIEHISAYEINRETHQLLKETFLELEQLYGVSQKSLMDQNENFEEGKAVAEHIHTKEVKEQVLSISDEGEGGCLVGFSMEDEQEAINFNAPKTSSFRVIIENPSKMQTKTVPVRYYLTKEIKGRDVISASGLKVGFDFERQLYYVYDRGVELKPAEQKTFDVILKNRWNIDKKGLYASKVYIDSMLRAATNAPEVKDVVDEKGASALEKCAQLLKRKEMEELTGDRLDMFRTDQELSEELEGDIREIEDILLEAGISPADSLMQQEEYCVKAKAEGLSKEEMLEGLKVSTVLETQRIKSMAGAIFKGKSISSASTWRIINYIILFLGVISSVFYFVNIRQQKSTMFDPLTGAFSRAYALERLREELKIAKGGGKKCSLLVMDIDKFKGINDTHGHAAGDLILKEFVIAIRKGIRATDLVGRFGGDEFIIILPTSEKKIAFKIAEGIARIVESTVINVTQRVTLNITTSIGVATFPDDSGTAEDIFDKADKALYEVKKRGGNGANAFGAGEG